MIDSEPDSRQSQPGHAFLDLGERLRQRGQFEAALSVAEAGVARYPSLAAAHDLVGRVRVDMGDDEAARSAWVATIECDPGHLGALKGLAFLAFRRKDFLEAERRLESASAASPRDPSILAALDRLRSSLPVVPVDDLQFDDPSSGLLLIDGQGLRLAGGTGSNDDGRIADAVSAEADSAIREVERTARLLGLGVWEHLLVEGVSSRVAVLPVGEQGTLLVHRPITAPAGRMLALAGRAVEAAKEWLGRNA